MELAERLTEFRFKQARPGVKTSHVYLAPYGTNFKGNSKELLLNKYFSKPLKQEVVDIIVNKTHTYVSFAETEKGRMAASACVENLMKCLKPDLLPRKLKCRFSVKFSKSPGFSIRPVKCVALSSNKNNDDLLGILGLKLYNDVISIEEEERLLSAIDEQPWSSKLKRRVQHYGYTFNYVTRSVDNKKKPPKLPEFLLSLYEKLFHGEDKFVCNVDGAPMLPDQCTINEYMPGQGISSHIDTHSAFHDRIMSLSLGSACVMNFLCEERSKDKIHLLLPRRSLLVLSKEARYIYAHGISPRKTDVYPDDTLVDRGRRVSITLRNVNFSASTDGCNCKYDEKYCDTKGAKVANGEIRMKNDEENANP